VADPAALRALANAMLKAAQTIHGFQRVKLHTSDGHEYYAMIVSGLQESEWQTVEPAYRGADLPTLSVLEDYESMKKELTETRSNVDS
jgi:hypothetical protein